MATDYEIQGSTRVCAASGRELKPGDRFCAVLTESDGRFVRTDYAVDHWPGPPDKAIAYWSGRVPAADRPQKPVINDELLLDCFQRLSDAVEPNQLRFRYVVALLLMRRKRMKFEDAKRDAADRDVLVIRDTRGGERFEIVDPRMTDAEMVDVQNEVFQMLGWTA
ncbi:MAG: hypothetical protein U0798_05380 [Gemmataceae bacterium]